MIDQCGIIYIRKIVFPIIFATEIMKRIKERWNMLYVVRLTPHDKKHKWKHYKNLINHIKRSHNSVITTDFVWFVELDEMNFESIADLYNDYIESKDKLQVKITEDIYSINIYKRSIGELPV